MLASPLAGKTLYDGIFVLRHLGLLSEKVFQSTARRTRVYSGRSDAGMDGRHPARFLGTFAFTRPIDWRHHSPVMCYLALAQQQGNARLARHTLVVARR